jgi:hypothetical protein
MQRSSRDILLQTMNAALLTCCKSTLDDFTLKSFHASTLHRKIPALFSSSSLLLKEVRDMFEQRESAVCRQAKMWSTAKENQDEKIENLKFIRDEKV